MRKSIVQIGKVFGRLTVISLSKRINKRNQKYFICKCECGNLKEVRGCSLSDGNTRSCGCLQKELRGIRCRLLPGEVSFNQLEHVYKTNSQFRGYEYNLSLEDFKEIITKNCYYCGSAPKPFNKFFKIDGTRMNSHFSVSGDWANQQWINVNGIDRKDNAIGYSKENCVSCCKICNQAKMDMSYSDFIDYLNSLVKFRTSF